jgi:hypothetical protein
VTATGATPHVAKSSAKFRTCEVINDGVENCARVATNTRQNAKEFVN